MAISQKGQVLSLSGFVGVEEAEDLYARLRELKSPRLNLTKCDHLHAAVVQLMLGFDVKIDKYPKNSALANWLLNSYTLRTR